MPGCVSDPRLAAFGDVAAPVPSASLRSSSACPSASASPVWASPYTGSRTHRPPVSAPSPTPLPALPATCFTRVPSAPGTTFAPPLADAPGALRTHQPRIVHSPRFNAVHLVALALRHGPPATARVAEDPLRASPAPLGDAGLPPSVGPVRTSSFASPVRASPVTGFHSPPSSVSAPLRTPRPVLPATCFARVPSAPSAVTTTQSPLPVTDSVEPAARSRLSSPASLAPVRASPVTGFRIMSCSGVRASSSVLRTHAVSAFSAARRTRAVRLATLVGTRFRTTSCTRVRTTADAAAVASRSVLRTTALSSSALTPTQSPWRLPSAGSSAAHPPVA